MTKKPMTVEEHATKLFLGCQHSKSKCDGSCLACTKQALLTFAAEQVREATEPLVVALERNAEERSWEQGHFCEFRKKLQACSQRSREALTAHRAKYPKKPHTEFLGLGEGA